MKIVEIVTLAELGGAQVVVRMLAEGLSEENEVHVVAGSGRFLPSVFAESPKIRFVRVRNLVRPIRPWHDLRALISLHRVLRSIAPDVVHCHSSKAGVVGRVAAWAARVPVVVFTAHGWGYIESESGGVMRFLLRNLERLLRRLQSFLVVESTSDLHTALKRRFGIRGRTEVIPNAACEVIPENGLRAAIVADQKSIVLGTVARLAYPKRVLETVDWFARFSERYPELDTHFVWIGEGPLRKEAITQVALHGLKDRFHLLGYQTNAMGLLSEADAFVLNSKWEGLPLAVIEAMSLGLPVVASNVGALAEVLVSGESGFVFDSDDELSDSVRTLALDLALRDRTGANARLTFLRDHEKSKFVEAHGKLFRRAFHVSKFRGKTQ